MNETYLNSTPAQEPPNGVLPNFDNPANVSGSMKLVTYLGLSLSWIFMVLRVWTRVAIQKRFTWEDYTIIVSWILNIVWIGLFIHSIQYGMGVLHMWDLSLSHFFVYLKLINALEIIYNLVICLTKVSIILQLQRLFCPHRTGWTNRLIQLLIISNTCFYFAITITTIWSCIPRSNIWRPTDQGHCLNIGLTLIASAVINMISDISLLVFPLYQVWRLHLPIKKKVGVSSVFIFGTLTCFCSIFRIIVTVIFVNTGDITTLTLAAMWVQGEMTGGIICGCLPTLPAIFRRLIHWLKAVPTHEHSRNLPVPPVQTSLEEVKSCNSPHDHLDEWIGSGPDRV